MAQRCSREEWEVARRWGSAHGYRGAIGGWVYDPEGNPVTQGWGALFFHIGREKMLQWAQAAGVLEEIMGVDSTRSIS